MANLNDYFRSVEEVLNKRENENDDKYALRIWHLLNPENVPMARWSDEDLNVAEQILLNAYNAEEFKAEGCNNNVSREMLAIDVVKLASKTAKNVAIENIPEELIDEGNLLLAKVRELLRIQDGNIEDAILIDGEPKDDDYIKARYEFELKREGVLKHRERLQKAANTRLEMLEQNETIGDSVIDITLENLTEEDVLRGDAPDFSELERKNNLEKLETEQLLEASGASMIYNSEIDDYEYSEDNGERIETLTENYLKALQNGNKEMLAPWVTRKYSIERVELFISACKFIAICVAETVKF